MDSNRTLYQNKKINRLTLPPWFYWVLLVIWMILIFLFSHQPALPKLPSGIADLLLKKSAHATAYAILMGLWWQAIKTVRPSSPTTLWLSLGLTLLYAISDEWHQTFIPGRNGQITDVFIDLGGALLMLVFIMRKY